jgi:hypothetical protein
MPGVLPGNGAFTGSAGCHSPGHISRDALFPCPRGYYTGPRRPLPADGRGYQALTAAASEPQRRIWPIKIAKYALSRPARAIRQPAGWRGAPRGGTVAGA